MFRQPREKNDAHRKFIASLPCLICGDDITTEAAHIRFQCRKAGKRYTGKGEKPHDRFTVPLCGKHHRAQHTMDEEKFWAGVNCDPIYVALALWGVTGNHELGCQIVREAQSAALTDA